MPPRPRSFNQRRQDRNEDDRQNHQREVLLHHRNVPEQVAGRNEAPDPQETPEHAESQEAQVVHPPDARDERGEGADDGHEARDDDRLDAVFLVELMGALQVRAVEPARAFAAEDLRPDEIADPVVGRIAEDRGEHQQKGYGVDIERAFGRQGSHREEQRVAGQKRRHDQSRLAEDDRKQNGVRKAAVARDQINQVCVEVENDVNEVFD